MDSIKWLVKPDGQKRPVIIPQPVNEQEREEAKKLMGKLSKKAARLTGRF